MAELGREGEDLNQEITAGHGDSPGLLVVDWARYEGQFDRIDGAMRHRMACLIALDGVLFLVLTLLAIVPAVGNREIATAFVAFLPWLGLSVSLAIFWKQYLVHEYRRDLQRAWKLHYPGIRPTPLGLESRDPGTLVGRPGVLFALLSSVTWLLVSVYLLAQFLSLDSKMRVYLISKLPITWAGIMGCVTVVLFCAVAATHFTNRDLEGK